MIQKTTYVKKFYRHLMAIASIALASCSSSSTPTASLTMTSVSMYAQPDANQNSALAVDLVIIYNADLLSTLSHMSAKTYFAASKQLLLDNPTLLDIWHWELVPGQIVQNFQPPQNKGEAFGAYLFADYHTPGDHRVRVTPDGVLNILFTRDDLKNLSTLSAHDVQTGTTMTTPLCWGDSTSGNLKQGSTASNSSSQGCVNLGPATTVTQPCNPVAPQPTQAPPCVPAVPSGGQQGPLPIVAQPLPPIKKSSLSISAPCNSKCN